MKKFTIREKADGELAVRDMSEKAKKFYSGTDMIAVAKYVEEEATIAAEAKADAEGIDHMPGALDVVRYALIWDNDVTDGLTFEQIEREIESLADAYAEEEDEDDGTVTNAFGVEIDFAAAVALMDDEIREEIHRDIAPCTEQEFFDAYAAAHEDRFGEEWELAKRNPCY